MSIYELNFVYNHATRMPDQTAVKDASKKHGVIISWPNNRTNTCIVDTTHGNAASFFDDSEKLGYQAIPGSF